MVLNLPPSSPAVKLLGGESVWCICGWGFTSLGELLEGKCWLSCYTPLKMNVCCSRGRACILEGRISIEAMDYVAVYREFRGYILASTILESAIRFCNANRQKM